MQCHLILKLFATTPGVRNWDVFAFGFVFFTHGSWESSDSNKSLRDSVQPAELELLFLLPQFT